MSEKKTAAVATPAPNALAPFEKDWVDSVTAAKYWDTSKDSQSVNAVGPSASPDTVKADAIINPETRKVFRERVLNAPLDKVRAGLFSLDKALTSICWKTMNRAYTTRSPWMVSECLSVLKPLINRTDFSKVKQYFTVAGFELSQSGVIMCLGIRDVSQHRAAVETLRGKTVGFIRLVKPTSTAEALSDDPSKRIRDAITRAHDVAKKKAASDATPEGQAHYAREMALATASREILALLVEQDDPLQLVAQFKAWISNPHSNELTEAK